MMEALSLRWKTPVAAMVATFALAGCDSKQGTSPTPVQVVTAAPRVMPTTAASPTKMPAPPVARPTPVPTTLADMRPRKTFVDPPLPPELQDDGGLRPLPPPPAR